MIGAICDANVLIDYARADEALIAELVGFWGRVYVPDIVLREVRQLPRERAEALGSSSWKRLFRFPRCGVCLFKTAPVSISSSRTA